MPDIGHPDSWSGRARQLYEQDLARLGGVVAPEETAESLKEKGFGWRAAARLIRARNASYLKEGIHRKGKGHVVHPAPVVPDDLPRPPRWDEGQRTPTPYRIEKSPLPGDEERPIDELLEEAETRYRRTEQRAASHGVRTIKMRPGPYAIAHFGDPHLDDDGCNWPSLRRAVRTVASTHSMYAGNVGDITNNWAGKLARLYGSQSATIEEGWRLARWLLEAVPWMYLVLGNHDQWNQGQVVYRMLTDTKQVELMAPDDVRFELHSPGAERPVRFHIRHDFPGRSMWNRVHGPMRASKLDPWADVYVAGHRHEWAAQFEEGLDGQVRYALRAKGFKRFDSYARSLGFPEQQHGEVITTVIDPTHLHPAERIRIYLDIEEAAEALTWLRKRRGV